MLLLLACVEADPKPADSADDRGDTDEVGPDPATVALTGECPLESHLGGFVVEVYTDYSIVDGSVSDGVVPITILEEIARAGDCVMRRRDNPFCNPACGPDETCDFDGTCLPYPTEQDLGTVRVTGLVDAVAMEPLPPGARYFDTRLSHPAFTPGALVELTAGGWVGEVVLHGVGVAPILPGEPTWSLRTGEDLVVSWDVPTGVVRAEVALRVSVDQHGSSPASLACAFADDGEGTVPASLVDALRAAGVSGFPSGLLSRRTADHVDLPEGCMDFVVGTPRVPDVRVDGVTPCDEQADCPEGTSCNLALEICE